MRRWGVLFVLSLSVLTALGVATAPAAGAAAPAASPSPAAWTYAFYTNEDNDLAYTWAQFTRPFLARIPTNPQVHIVAMVDMPGKGGTTLFELGGGACKKVATFPEKDFGSGATLEWFLEQIHARYPSDHLGVSILDHGYAWRGFSWDQTSSWDNITMPEMTQAVEGAGVPIDVLSFDACNMGDVEVAYQLSLMQGGSPAAPLVKYLVGSEEEIDQDGIPYDIAFAPLVADPSLAPSDLARDLVSAYQRYYLPRRSFNWTSMSAIDVTKVGAATADLQAWVARMTLDLPTLKSRYDADLRTCIYAWESWHVDLAQLCDALAADPQIADTTLKTLSATVANDCRGAVLGLWSGSYSAAYQGMTIWWGADQDWPYYRTDYLHQVAFGQPAPTGAGWYAFLKAYNAAAAAGSAAPAALPAAPAPHGAKSATARHSAKTLSDGLGWPHTTTVRASYGLAGVDFLDQQNGWAVGYNNVSENAIILHTTDGGAHWRVRSPLAWYAYEFAGIDALDPAHIWTAGSESWVDSLITGSTDGSTWKTEPSPTVEYLMSVDFTDAQNGWICGTNGALLHTRSGGAHWAKAPTWDGARGDDLWAVDFTDAQHGWIAGGNAATLTGFIRRTTDGGQTWTVQQLVPGAVLYGIEAPRCAVGGDPVTGASVAYYSTDGGAAWNPSSGTPPGEWLSKVTRAPGGTVDWAVGSAGTVLESTDDGAAWTSPPAPVPATFDLAAASFTSDTDGWIVGDGEQMLRTTDGGASWQTAVADVLWPRAHARGIEFPLSDRPSELRFGYQVLDNVSATATVTITVTRHGNVVRRYRLGSQPCGGLQWTPRFTSTLPPGHYVMHVSAVDESGNRSRQRPFSSLGFAIGH